MLKDLLPLETFSNNKKELQRRKEVHWFNHWPNTSCGVRLLLMALRVLGPSLTLFFYLEMNYFLLRQSACLQQPNKSFSRTLTWQEHRHARRCSCIDIQIYAHITHLRFKPPLWSSGKISTCWKDTLQMEKVLMWEREEKKDREKERKKGRKTDRQTECGRIYLKKTK